MPNDPALLLSLESRPKAALAASEEF